MIRFYLIILLAFFVSCKKEIHPTPASKPHTVFSDKNSDKNIDTKPLTISVSEIEKFKSKLLLEFYQSKNNTTVWLSTKQRRIALSTLNNSHKEGLNPEDYEVTKLNQFEKNSNSLSDEDWVKYDLLLTNSLKDYIFHLAHGKLNPQKLYKNWDLKENNTDIVKTLIDLHKNDSLLIKIEQLKPQHIVYKKLKEALDIISGFPDDNFRPLAFKKNINPDDTNPLLIDIKKRLIYWKDMEFQDSLTPVYDKETFKAMVRFQIRHGLSADGIIGKGTIESLNFTKNQRKNQIIANLERWKWFPRELGNEYIIINIPDFRLQVVANNDTVRTHRVIVGTIKRKTPVLSSKLENAVFNPTWTVPPTILREDVIPATSKDRSYLASKNITIYDDGGNVISAEQWEADKANNYRYVQSPGTFNSLGMVKLVFPNRFSVYLHDTNHRDYFTQTNRSLSSGCVRVEDPLELTEYLLADSKWDLNTITETLKENKTKYVTIKKSVFIHILYWTAWSEENKLIFRDDIYNLDADLSSKLGN